MREREKERKRDGDFGKKNRKGEWKEKDWKGSKKPFETDRKNIDSSSSFFFFFAWLSSFPSVRAFSPHLLLLLRFPPPPLSFYFFFFFRFLPLYSTEKPSDRIFTLCDALFQGTSSFWAAVLTRVAPSEDYNSGGHRFDFPSWSYLSSTSRSLSVCVLLLLFLLPLALSLFL